MEKMEKVDEVDEVRSVRCHVMHAHAIAEACYGRGSTCGRRTRDCGDAISGGASVCVCVDLVIGRCASTCVWTRACRGWVLAYRQRIRRRALLCQDLLRQPHLLRLSNLAVPHGTQPPDWSCAAWRRGQNTGSRPQELLHTDPRFAGSTPPCCSSTAPTLLARLHRQESDLRSPRTSRLQHCCCSMGRLQPSAWRLPDGQLRNPRGQARGSCHD